MDNTTVVNLKVSSYDVYIGRAGRGQDGYFGNPIKLKIGDSKGSTLAKYKEYFDNRVQHDTEFRNKILSLKGKVLGCFCKPHACHGDIIAEYLNNQ